jgi:hypothetical protein
MAPDDVIPSVEDYFGNICDEKSLDTIPDGPIQTESGFTTSTTPPSQSEEILPYRPQRSSSLLRTEALVEAVFENNTVFTLAIDALSFMDDIFPWRGKTLLSRPRRLLLLLRAQPSPRLP